MWAKFKGGLWVILGCGILVLLLLLAVFFIQGAAWAGEKIYPWLQKASTITFFVTLFLLPLSFIRRTRGFAVITLMISSYVFGLTLWVWGLLLTYYLWGVGAVFVGLFMMGIGVVPIAMLATLFKGMWSTLGELIFLTILVFGLRAYSVYVAQKEVDREAYIELEKIEVPPYE